MISYTLLLRFLKKVKSYHNKIRYLVKMYRNNAMIRMTYSAHVYMKILKNRGVCDYEL